MSMARAPMRRVGPVRGLASVFAVIVGWTAATAAQGQESPWRGFAAAEGGGAALTSITEGSSESLAGHYALRAGARTERWGCALRAEQTFWRTPERRRTTVQSAVAVSLGVEHVYAAGRLRTALDGGAAILTRDNAIDDAGAVGFFIDLRPVGLRWTVGDRVTVGFDPLHVAMVAPVLQGIPLVDVQYRTTFYLELGFPPRRAR